MTNALPDRPKKLMSRRAALGLILGSSASAALAQTFPHQLDASPIPHPRPRDLFKRAIPSAQDLIDAAGLSGRHAFALVDLNTGETLESAAPLRRLPPASVAKTVTGLYALEALGGEFRFETRVLATGPITNGHLAGDLILEGSGDPTLDTDSLGALVDQLAQLGLRNISGNFYLWDGALPRIDEIDQAQTEYAGYNPTISGLNLNFNRVHFEWRREGSDYAIKMDARAKRYAPDVKIARMSIAPRNLPVFDHEDGQGFDAWSVARSALGNGGARWLPVRLPALYAGEVFQTIARQQGINLPKPKRLDRAPSGTQLARHASAPLTTLVRDMLKYSTNLTAEVLGLRASIKRGGAPNTLADSATQMNAWARVALGTRHLAFVDHSGLGGESVISAADMARLLAQPITVSRLAPLLKPVAMPDASGQKIDPNHPIKAVAKTGTLDFVSTLAGYVDTPDGRRMAFAIFSADLPKRAEAKAAQNEVPAGARRFNQRSRNLQKALLNRWGFVYAT